MTKDKTKEYVERFVEFYADFLRCLDEEIYKPKEGWQILAEECHYLYHQIQRDQMSINQ